MPPPPALAVPTTNWSVSKDGPRHLLSDLRTRLASELGEARARGLWAAVDDLVVKMFLSATAPQRRPRALRAATAATGRASLHPGAAALNSSGST